MLADSLHEIDGKGVRGTRGVGVGGESEEGGGLREKREGEKGREMEEASSSASDRGRAWLIVKPLEARRALFYLNNLFLFCFCFVLCFCFYVANFFNLSDRVRI